MTTPIQSFNFDYDMATPVPGAYASSPRTPTNANIPFVVPGAPKKVSSYVPRCRLVRQVPEGFAYHPILQRRGLPPLRKIEF